MHVCLLPYLSISNQDESILVLKIDFWTKEGSKVEIGTQTMFSSAARLQMTAWREGLAAG